MANTLTLKNSVTAGNAPTVLEQGEMAINVSDKIVWVGNAAKAPVVIVDGKTISTYHGTIAGGALTKVSGTVTVTRVSTGVYQITAAITDGVVFNAMGGIGHVVASEIPTGAGSRVFHVRDAETLARTLTDPASITVTVIA